MSYSLSEFLQQFPTDDACLQYLFEKKYKDTTCPKCGKVGVFYRNRSLPCYTCSCGRHHLYPRKGTIFSGGRVSLQKYFLVIFLCATGHHSTMGLQKMVGASYPTVLVMQTQILELMAKNIKDRDHLSQWRNKAIAIYRRLPEEHMDLYLSSFQFKQEQEKEKHDPFFHLLDLAMHV